MDGVSGRIVDTIDLWHRGPIAYPVARAPQSWAPEAPLRCLGHALGSASATKTMRPNFVTRFCLVSSNM